MKKFYFLLIALLATFAANASKVYYDNSETNWASVNAYVWGGSVTGAATWPGDAMTLNAETGLWEAEFTGTPANIIFSNNGKNQTGDLTFKDGETYDQNGVKGAEMKEYVVAYFDNSESNWASVYCYTFDPVTFGAWPGKLMELDAETGLYVAKITATEPPVNGKVIFNNRSVQTANLDLIIGETYTKNGLKSDPRPEYADWYVNLPGDYNKWSDNGVQPGLNPVVTFTIPSYSGKFRVKLWYDNKDHVYSNKGEIAANEWVTLTPQASIEEEGYEDMWLPAGADGQKVVMKFNVETNQLYAEVELKQVETKAYTVSFDNTNSEWASVYAYVYNEDGSYNIAAWPGTEMTKGEGNVWTYNFESTWEPAYVIFSDNNGNQTENLVFENEKTYDTPAPVAYNVSFDNGLTAWETVYAYVFDAEGNSFVAAWPGVEMTKGEGTVYTYDFKAVFTPATVIFNDGKAEGAQQTDNLAFENGKVYGDPAPVVVENVLVKWDNTTANYNAPYANWAIETNGEYVAVAMTEIMEEVETPDVPEQPEAKVVTYNFSDFAAGDFTEETKVGDLTVYATATGKITVDASAKTIDGVAYTQRLKFGGTGNVKNGTPSRVIGFPVDGPCTITAAATSSNGTEDRTLNVFAVDGSVLGTIAAPAGTIAVGSYAYTGEAATLYLGSAKSGLNIYFVKVEYPAAEANALAIEYVGTGIWQAELPQEAKYVYFTDGPAERGENKLFAVEHEKTYSPATEGVTGVESVAVDANAPAVYYNLQGVRVANPVAGQVYIMVQGNKTAKVIK